MNQRVIPNSRGVKRKAFTRVDDVLYDVTATAFIEETGEFLLKATWLERAENVYISDITSVPIKKARPCGIQSLDEIYTKTKEFKLKLDAGAKIFSCPYCHVKATPNEKTNMKNHINGFKKLDDNRIEKVFKPCKQRRKMEPTVRALHIMDPLDVTAEEKNLILPLVKNRMNGRERIREKKENEI